MSGTKTRYRTITDNEYWNLKNKANQQTFTNQKLIATQKANKQLQDDLSAAKKHNKSIESKIEKLERDLDNSSKNASALKKQLDQSIKDSNEAIKSLQSKYDKSLEDTKKEFDVKMAKNNSRIEQIIADETNGIRKDMEDLRKGTQKEIDKIKATVSDIASKVGDPMEIIGIAGDYLSSAEELVTDSKNYRHELFFPGALEEIEKKVSKAQKAVAFAKNNPADASKAHSDCEKAFEDALKFRNDLIAAETEWANKLALALEALAVADTEIGAHEKVEIEGKKHDTDFWTGGGVSALKKAVEDLRKHLTDEKNAKNLSIADLEGITERAKSIADEAEKITVGAIFAIENSEERAVLAADLAEELALRAGMEIIKQEGFEAGDQRAANLVHLKNGTTGFEVVVTLSPVFDDGKCGYRADTAIVSEGDSVQVKDSFDTALKEVMADYDLWGNDPIPVNEKKKDEVKNWQTRKATTVATVKANVHDKSQTA